MTKDKALKLALEALECVLDDSPKVLDASISGGLYEVVQCRDAITAINEALAQPERQPLTSHPSSVHPLRRGDILRCIETDELCTVWATSTTGKTLVKWSANNFGDYTAEQIGELFWIEPEPVQEHHGCACRWNDEGDRTVTCERHQGWLEVIAEWADRAREAEAKLKATLPAAQRKPLGEHEIVKILDRERMKWIKSPPTYEFDLAFVRAIEAAHGIKE